MSIDSPFGHSHTLGEEKLMALVKRRAGPIRASPNKGILSGDHGTQVKHMVKKSE